ncbi:MAG TPA: carbohydrate ABC transporter permease [Paracoccaceae bacterium]|nr:carbohydrate ABC transporter permease [Paracoccaceae bacterium]
MSNNPLRWAVHLSVVLFVLLWTLPTLGLLVTSFRDKDQITTSGWWTALGTSTQSAMFRAPEGEGEVLEGTLYTLKGTVFEGQGGQIGTFGISSKAPDAFKAGEVADLGDGANLTVSADGSFVLSAPESFKDKRGQRIFYTASVPPRFTFDNYRSVLTAEGLGRSFLNSATVAIPSTVIPILIAAFAAYALSWMQFPGRALLIAAVVGLLVVPLQMSLIPLLTLYNSAGQQLGFDPKSYIGIWLAHTGFGLPLAIYLLRNYMSGLPREIMESARVDGATDFQIFTKIVLPLSFPALASFAIFQFLWTWNDLLVALVFLGPQDDKLVLTGRLVNLLGSRGGDWEILAASAFVSIAVPVFVFFALQKYLVRGLLAGSVK